jgi:hypothetical protein
MFAIHRLATSTQESAGTACKIVNIGRATGQTLLRNAPMSNPSSHPINVDVNRAKKNLTSEIIKSEQLEETATIAELIISFVDGNKYGGRLAWPDSISATSIAIATI